MKDIIEELRGVDRRSIGKSNAVVTNVLANPTIFPALIEGLRHDDPIIRMRAADVVEKVTLVHPEWLKPYKKILLTKIALIDQQEVRWHVAQLFSRLELTHAERLLVLDICQLYLKDKSSILRTFAMQAMADIAFCEPTLRPAIIAQVKALTLSGTPAMKARGKKLLRRLEKLSE